MMDAKFQYSKNARMNCHEVKNDQAASPIAARPPRPPALAWFGDMIDHCLEHAQQARAEKKPLIGILCEYAPRELIMAAGRPASLPVAARRTPSRPRRRICRQPVSADQIDVWLPCFEIHPFLEMADLVVRKPPATAKKRCSSDGPGPGRLLDRIAPEGKSTRLPSTIGSRSCGGSVISWPTVTKRPSATTASPPPSPS